MTVAMLFIPLVSWLSEELIITLDPLLYFSCQLSHFVWIESRLLPTATPISLGGSDSRCPLLITEAQDKETSSSISCTLPPFDHIVTGKGWGPRWVCPCMVWNVWVLYLMQERSHNTSPGDFECVC